jgi:hypothetical protein
MATWSRGVELDWFVRNTWNGGVAYTVLTTANGESEPVIFILWAAHSTDLLSSFVGVVAKSLPKRTLQDSRILDLSPGRRRQLRA